MASINSWEAGSDDGVCCKIEIFFKKKKKKKKNDSLLEETSTMGMQ